MKAINPEIKAARGAQSKRKVQETTLSHNIGGERLIKELIPINA